MLDTITRTGTDGALFLRDAAQSAGTQIAALADREDVAEHPVLVRALRNIGGLPYRPARELALGAAGLALMIVTDSIVVDLATNAVGILFINHPHEPDVTGPPAMTADRRDWTTT